MHNACQQNFMRFPGLCEVYSSNYGSELMALTWKHAVPLKRKEFFKEQYLSDTLCWKCNSGRAMSHFQYYYRTKWMAPERLISVTNLLVLPQNLIRYSLCCMVLCFSAVDPCRNLCFLYLLSKCLEYSFPCKDKSWIIRLLCQFMELPDFPICLWLCFWILFWKMLCISLSL